MKLKTGSLKIPWFLGPKSVMGTISLTQSGILHQHHALTIKSIAKIGIRSHILSILNSFDPIVLFCHFMPRSYYKLPALPLKQGIQLVQSAFMVFTRLRFTSNFFVQHNALLTHYCKWQIMGRKYILPTFSQPNITF
jgi:hypothetical protein